AYNSGSTDAGWSSLVARRAHNPKVAGSNPAPATNEGPGQSDFWPGPSDVRGQTSNGSSNGSAVQRIQVPAPAIPARLIYRCDRQRLRCDYEPMHRPGPGPSDGKWSGGLPCTWRPRLWRLLLVAPVLPPAIGLHAAGQRQGRHEQWEWWVRQ